MTEADPKIFVSDIVPPTAETHELKVVKKKARKPMSQTRKEELKEQLAKAREVKKAKRLAEKALKDAAKAEKKEAPAAAPAVEVALEGTEKVLVKKEPEVVVDTTHLGTPKTVLDQLLELKEEVKELRKGGTSKEDMEEIKSLKLEMKELRDAAKLYKESQKEKKKIKDKVVRKKKAIEEAPVVAPPAPAPRYSTYKKSIWTNLM
tara:strand:- start:304 stop:918 length:615 start_codon:yes stop_codon:yes gene_type:complete